MLTFIKYNLWAILWGLLIILITILPGRLIPKIPDFLDLFQPDKLLHLLVFCVYFMLQRWSFLRQPAYPWFRRHAAMITLLISVALASGTELMQHYVIPMRTGSAYDFIANVAGCLVGYWLANKVKAFQNASNGRGSSGR